MVKVSLRLATYLFMYRVAQQCCPGGNRPETPGDPPRGGHRNILAKLMAIPAICNSSSPLTNLSLNFVYMPGITSDLAQKIQRPPAEGLRGSPDDFRRDNIAGSHGMLHLALPKRLINCSLNQLSKG